MTNAEIEVEALEGNDLLANKKWWYQNVGIEYCEDTEIYELPEIASFDSIQYAFTDDKIDTINFDNLMCTLESGIFEFNIPLCSCNDQNFTHSSTTLPTVKTFEGKEYRYICCIGNFCEDVEIQDDDGNLAYYNHGQNSLNIWELVE